MSLETKIELVRSGRSRVFRNWSRHSSISMEQFIEALEWLEADPGTAHGYPTRAAALTATGWRKLSYDYDRKHHHVYLCALDSRGRERDWDGEPFERVLSGEEAAPYGPTATEYHKVCLDKHDWA